MTQREALLALLDSLFDLFPQPETATGSLQRRGRVSRRLAPSRKTPCPTCGDNPEPGRLGSLRPCQVCGGQPDTGKPGRGWIWTDPYDRFSREIGGHGGSTAPSKVSVRCLECRNGRLPNGKDCLACRGSGSVTRFNHTVDLASGKPVPIEEPEDTPDGDALDGMLAGLSRREKAGHYRELTNALDLLRGREPSWHRIVVAVHVEHSKGKLTAGDHQRLERGLSWLEQQMPNPVQVPGYLEARIKNQSKKESLWFGKGAQHVQGRADRNVEISRLHGEGMTVRELMDLYDLSKNQIYLVLKARAEAA